MNEQIKIMTNILYIHGFGSDENSNTSQVLRKSLSNNYKVLTHSFSNNYELFESMSSNIAKAKELIETMEIDLVVASSMGGFIAKECPDVKKILINPCMKPSEHLRFRIAPNISEEQLNEYRLQEYLFKPTPYCFKHTYGLFSTKDELFSYKDYFDTIYNPDNSFSIDGEHRISTINIEDVLVPLIHKV